MANSPARSAIDVGTVIAGTYTIEALIGRGGMGAVFLASHARLPGKQVAIKVLHSDLTEDEVMARFKREAEIASRLGHPNIVAVHDFNALPDGAPYLVLEYLTGENLAQRIKRGPMTLAEVVPIVRQIASALAAAHKEGIVHRDLKPANVFLVPTEVAGAVVEQVKVLDFGISKIRGSTTVKTQDSAMLGTPQYMAPEQALGKHADVDERTDIFALGSIVYEMLCGQPAFVGASVPEVVFKVVYEEPAPLAQRVPGVAPAAAAAVHKALAKPQDQRFASVNDFFVALSGEQVSLVRAPRGGAPASIPPADPKVSSAEALANTVGSGDHGEPPLAIAETQASGDHRDSRPVVATGTSAGTSAPGAAPAKRRAPIVALLTIMLGAGVAITVGVTRDDDDGATPVTTPPALDAAAPIAVVAADAAPIAVVATPVDAAAAPADATRVAAAKIDAARGRPVKKAAAAPDSGDPLGDDPDDPDEPDDGPVDPNARTPRQLYQEGLAALRAKDPDRAAQLGNRLTDRGNDPRGWVLRGAAACQTNRLPQLRVAQEQLAGRGKFLAQLQRLCGRRAGR
jgi:serine/threonine-protein kinase